MSHDTKLGTVPTENDGRDAVHIAILPMRAAQFLPSGCPVKLNKNGDAIPCDPEDAVGVVDPFLTKAQIFEGELFWLCLYPKTITSLRHVWEHPSFPLSFSGSISPEKAKATIPKTEIITPKRKSEKWLEQYVRQHCPYWEHESDGGYSRFLANVKYDKMIFYNGSDCHSLSEVEDADELFRHLSIILDMRIDANYFDTFTCSC